MGPIRQTSFVSPVRHCCCCGCPERGRRMPSKSSRKRKRLERRPTIHPKNKYAESPPDFGLLASLYPSFQPYVFYSRDGSPRIDWTDFNATRELTRVLLLHDHGLNWWIPDGQLCPTVPNRSNYIHWIEDLLASDIIPKNQSDADVVRGFDIGTGANCIYPLLGASLLGWSFVGSDVTDVALQWAERNVKSNPHISDLIEIRKARGCQETLSTEESPDFISVNGASQTSTNRSVIKEAESSFTSAADTNNHHSRPPVLLGLVGADEKFDFCMCNPPFFETMEEASLNPKTACGGTLEEMVCPGGEQAFITSIIEDSVVLKDSFRWYSSMVGRKTNLKFLTSKLWEVGATIVKTTEFVQGKTCRWGLAWSFIPPVRKLTTPQVAEKSILTFMLEGLEHQYSAIHVLQSIESFFHVTGASCKLNSSSFYVDVNASKEQCDALLNESEHLDAPDGCNPLEHISNGSSNRHIPLNNLSFRIMVFQQIPGTLLVKGSLQHKDNMVSGVLSSIMQQLEQILKQKFCRTKASFNKIV